MSKNPVAKNLPKSGGGVHNRHEQRAFLKRKLNDEIEKELDEYIEEEIKEIDERIS